MRVQTECREGNSERWSSNPSRTLPGKLCSFPAFTDQDIKSLCDLNAQSAMASDSRRRDRFLSQGRGNLGTATAENGGSFQEAEESVSYSGPTRRGQD